MSRLKNATRHLSTDPLRLRIARRLSMLLVATTAALASAPVLAHHGWNWAVDEQSELAGTIEEIDPTLIRTLMDADFVPLVTPPALAHEGVPINVDGDKLAQKLAESLGADGLLFFSDTPGLLADRHDESTLIRSIDAGNPESALAAAEGRMLVKVEQAVKAVERGVGQVVFSDARVERPVTKALQGEGTVIRREAVVI